MKIRGTMKSLIFVALGLALILSACGQGGTGQPATTETSADAGAEAAAGDADAVTAADSTFPVKATAGITTGLVRLAHTEALLPPIAPSIDWGDGTTSPVLLDCTAVPRPLLPPLIACDYWNQHTYAQPGTYPITITYDLIVEINTSAVVSPVGNFVIVSIGDSVASGEGNPVVPARIEGLLSHRPYWDNESCHISSRGGPALAAREIQSTNPGASVTFIHLACSGKNIGQIAQQLGTAAALLPADRIDALLISAGANDVNGGFGMTVGACLGPVPPEGTPDPSIDCSTDAGFANTLATDIAGLDYSRITTSIEGNNLDVSDVYITEYFDPTHDSFGNFPGPVVDAICTGGLMKEAEWEFLYNHMVVPLNDKVQTTSAGPPDGQGWHFVGNLASDFLFHGYCADPTPGNPTGLSWVVKVPESFIIQEDVFGTAHPNGSGHARYRTRIVNAINFWTPPITTATATAGGQPYAFGTWTNEDVTVTLAATNKLATAGTGATYYDVDDFLCESGAVSSCMTYAGPFTVSDSGMHAVSYFSENASGSLEDPNTAEVLIDKDPPVMTCSSSPPTLWPPNGRLLPVTLTVTAIDAVFGPSPFFLKSVTTSEGDASSDIQSFDIGEPDTEGWLLARRRGGGTGRVYTFTYESSDELGNTGTCTLEVPVPHDRRPSNR